MIGYYWFTVRLVFFFQKKIKEVWLTKFFCSLLHNIFIFDINMSTQETALVYAALICQDSDVEITVCLI